MGGDSVVQPVGKLRDRAVAGPGWATSTALHPYPAPKKTSLRQTLRVKISCRWCHAKVVSQYPGSDPCGSSMKLGVMAFAQLLFVTAFLQRAAALLFGEGAGFPSERTVMRAMVTNPSRIP